MQDSIFTKIIKGEIPCHKIYEDDNVIAFLDVHPQTEGHTLVVPKRQVDHLWDLDQVEYEVLWHAVKKIGAHLKDEIGSPRVGVVVEGFGVPHVHVHLIPIYHGEDLKKAQDLESEPDHVALAQLAKRLAL
ncbi:HIT domain-containing protein [Candidatus Saccharibacteria bacterium]|nr:HIT domain-containing protein [Candidatus Saccharibacteria bacterium]MBH1973184.1 HIT domain-containing protein [Candidatus Saccharibacteria bacterium]MBH1990575.1 HIT domain-containing protein [Candidatus Saccharibacteria bacterium]